jgi:hypothetical protein
MNDKHKLVIGEVFGGYEFKISYPESIRHSIPVSWKGVFRYQSEQIVKAVSIPCQLRKLKGHMIQERILWPLMANPNHLWNQNDK